MNKFIQWFLLCKTSLEACNRMITGLHTDNMILESQELPPSSQLSSRRTVQGWSVAEVRSSCWLNLKVVDKANRLIGHFPGLFVEPRAFCLAPRSSFTCEECKSADLTNTSDDACPTSSATGNRLFELIFELAHARSIFSLLHRSWVLLGVELPKLQLPNWYHGKLPEKCQSWLRRLGVCDCHHKGLGPRLRTHTATRWQRPLTRRWGSKGQIRT